MNSTSTEIRASADMYDHARTARHNISYVYYHTCATIRGVPHVLPPAYDSITSTRTIRLQLLGNCPKFAATALAVHHAYDQKCTYHYRSTQLVPSLTRAPSTPIPRAPTALGLYLVATCRALVAVATWRPTNTASTGTSPGYCLTRAHRSCTCRACCMTSWLGRT